MNLEKKKFANFTKQLTTFCRNKKAYTNVSSEVLKKGLLSKSLPPPSPLNMYDTTTNLPEMQIERSHEMKTMNTFPLDLN